MQYIKKSAMSLLGVSLVTLGLSGCGSSSDSSSQSCDIDSKVDYWYSEMQYAYLWNNDLKPLRSNYTTSDQMVIDVRANIDRYSRVVNSTFFDNLIAGDQVGNLGFETDRSSQTPTVTLVEPNSNAYTAGIQRGDKITNIIETSSSTSQISWTNVMGDQFTKVIERSDFESTSVFKAEVLTTNSGKVGYMAFTSGFINTSPKEIEQAFNLFSQHNLAEFILDLRENGGGLGAVADTLNLYLGGQNVIGKISDRTLHNNNLAEFNSISLFGQSNDSYRNNVNPSMKTAQQIMPLALNLPRIIIITNPNTASASERVINNLSPYLDVVLIGSKTYGKPVGSYASNDFCDETLLAINTVDENAAGFSNYYSGFQPNCAVTYRAPKGDWGSGTDLEFQTALHYAENGVCPTQISATQRSDFANKPEFEAPYVTEPRFTLMIK